MGSSTNSALLWSGLVRNPLVHNLCLSLSQTRICISVAFSIYLMAGREIFIKRRELRAFSQQPLHKEEVENPFTSFKTTEVHITSELVPLPPERPSDTVCKSQAGNGMFQDRGYDRYTVTIASNPRATRPTTPSGELLALRHHKVAMEANSAAWGYTKIAVLFFISLLITWVRQKIPYGLPTPAPFQRLPAC